MADDRQSLQEALVLSYDYLRKRLTRRLGSADLAGDVLHETYLKLSSPRSDDAAMIGPVRDPIPYILRAAINAALQRFNRDKPFVSLSDAKAALDIPDEMPLPSQSAEARFEIDSLQRALDELPPRQREILLASRIDGVPLREIAGRYGLSQRMVEIELKRAVAFCAQRLDRDVIQRFGPRPSDTSEG